MFTVKHVAPNGEEHVVSVTSVQFDREANVLRGLGADGVAFVGWTAGHAYVMNESGRTVAVYNIAMPVGTVPVAAEQVAHAREVARKATK